MTPRNSTTLMLRALVMLGCLVALPTWALWGTSLPERIQTLLHARDQLVGDTPGDELESAPPFSPGGLVGGEKAAGSGQAGPVDSGGVAALAVPPHPPAGPKQPPSEVVPASFESAANPSPRPTPDISQETVDNRFLAVQKRLRQLGAIYYRLETWGNRGELFRFHCKVAVHGSAAFARHFEDTDPHPLTAMTTVLQEVEAWRAGL